MVVGDDSNRDREKEVGDIKHHTNTDGPMKTKLPLEYEEHSCQDRINERASVGFITKQKNPLLVVETYNPQAVTAVSEGNIGHAPGG